MSWWVSDHGQSLLIWLKCLIEYFNSLYTFSFVNNLALLVRLHFVVHTICPDGKSNAILVVHCLLEKKYRASGTFLDTSAPVYSRTIESRGQPTRAGEEHVKYL